MGEAIQVGLGRAHEEKPAGSIIEESVDPGGVTLSWPTPSPGMGHYASAAFLSFWLCGWAFGWVAAVSVIFTIVVKGEGLFALLFLVPWLGGWTVGGWFAITSLRAMLGPTHPESIRLEADLLRYEPGRSRYDPWREHEWWVSGHRGLLRPTPAIEACRSDIGTFILERIGERQRLCFDRGADRLEIGACLREPEREWLYAVLCRWHAGQRL